MMDLIIITQADYALLKCIHGYASLRDELERAIVVASEAVYSDVVTMNSRILYSDQLDVRKRITLVYPPRVNRKAGRVSVLSATTAASASSGKDLGVRGVFAPLPAHLLEDAE